jgi:DNA-binding response OmpR family regulator
MCGIPGDKRPRERPGQAGPRSPAIGAVPGRVLLVDAEVETVRGVASALEPRGYRVEAVRALPRARLVLALTRLPDAVVLDCHLPQRESFALCRELRARANGVPVLVLAGEVSLVHFKAALAAGASLVLAKPVEGARLAGALAWLLAQRRARLAG